MSTETLIYDLLQEQRQLTAVEQFAQQHDRATLPLQARYYRELIPSRAPAAGEQYAFEVDLDACSGCKACVTACHKMNGLEEREVWRTVGLLHGGSTDEPVLQHVTASCHHCLEPACLHGCPVAAYEKDPATGIVRHLDDQCIGCTYCIFQCPYDVPRYSASKGIVRKCDMCQQRLVVGEAPACVQACPNQAIQIQIVQQQTVVDDSRASVFVPGAADPNGTFPTTSYRTRRALPRNLVPADFHAARPAQAHGPLVVMLVLTQMSVGAFAAERYLFLQIQRLAEVLPASLRLIHLLAALGLGVLGMAAALLHLGRPWYAYRALIGWKTSWLSREIVAFSLFALLATAYATSVATGISPAYALGSASLLTGMVAVGCSIMIYVDTQRPYWTLPYTGVRFTGTMFLLGIPTALLIALAGAAVSHAMPVAQLMENGGNAFCRTLIAVSVVKLLVETSVLGTLRQRAISPRKRTAQLLVGPLGLLMVQRLFFGGMGGIVLPLLLLSRESFGQGFHDLFLSGLASLILLMLLIGELLERYLFFTAATPPKMPGGVA